MQEKISKLLPSPACQDGGFSDSWGDDASFGNHDLIHPSGGLGTGSFVASSTVLFIPLGQGEAVSGFHNCDSRQHPAVSAVVGLHRQVEGRQEMGSGRSCENQN